MQPVYTPTQESVRQRKSGFTLVELMVVIAIIAMLMSLIIGAIFPWLKRLSEDGETERRINNLITNIEMRQDGDERIIDPLFRLVTGREINLAPLQEVISEQLRHRPGLLESTNTNELPPRLRTRAWQNTINYHAGQTPSAEWRMPGQGISYHVLFYDRQLIARVSRRWMNDNNPHQVPLPPADIWGPVQRGTPLFRFNYTGNEGSFHNIPTDNSASRLGSYADRSHHASPVGESLASTMEIMPDGPWYTDDFLEAWPNLTQEISGDGTIFTQYSWRDPLGNPWTEDADSQVWKSFDGSHATPIWGAPWGERVISRHPDDGYLVDYIEPHNLRVMNPLITPKLLQRIDLDPEEWRSNRDPNVPWNDVWGHPLLLAAATFHAPRYDFDDENEQVARAASFGDSVMVSRELHGGRDFMYRRSLEVYGYAKAVYLSAGAVGPTTHETLPESWDEGGDADVIRNAWQQILDVCEGEEWNERSFANPPWQGMRISTDSDGHKSFLRAPSTIR